MTPGRRRVAALLLAGAVAAVTACGARLPGALRRTAADAQLQVGIHPSAAPVAATGTGPAATGPAVAASVGAGPAPVVTTGTATTGRIAAAPPVASTAPTGSARPAATVAPAATASGPGAPAPPGGNGGATDVGVTATTITVGNVADLSGPVPGIFQSAPYGVEAYFAYVNANGGVYGRQLKVAVADSQTDCTANQNAHSVLLPKVFAFVGSFAIYDDCGTQVLEQNPTVPDLSYPLGPQTKRNTTNSFPPQAAPIGYQNGMFCYWAQKYGAAVQAVGSIYNAIPAATLSEHYFENSAGTCGWKWKDSIGVGATQTTFQAEVSKMQSDGVKIVFIAATNTGNAAEIKREADQQGWHPIWIMPLAYSSDFISRLGDPKEAEGIVGSQLYSLFFSPADTHIPAVGLYQQWMARAVPDAPLELYSAYSWAAAELFVQTLKAVGPDLTRAAFLTAIRKVHAFDTGGFLTPTDPAGHVPSPCYALWVITGGQYVRQDTPADGFRCDGAFVPYTGS